MGHAKQFYIDGAWVDPVSKETVDVINPATEEVVETIALGSASDVDRAVAAAKKAFESFSQTTKAERLALLDKIIAGYIERKDELAAAITTEMGAPSWLAAAAQVPAGLMHIVTAKQVREAMPASGTFQDRATNVLKNKKS